MNNRLDRIERTVLTTSNESQEEEAIAQWIVTTSKAWFNCL